MMIFYFEYHELGEQEKVHKVDEPFKYAITCTMYRLRSDEVGLCKGVARKTVFGFIQSMECKKFVLQSNVYFQG
ncbi:unnamed protein product [Brachionus calyciflorus]|uniref:Uncharacterized protein n=1 Tax=Brachionus calyciflorus TaxID=104777 RepID=A0A814HK27_9BILA|nr:unnamed protein product [Brachionus calyciflorus]